MNPELYTLSGLGVQDRSGIPCQLVSMSPMHGLPDIGLIDAHLCLYDGLRKL